MICRARFPEDREEIINLWSSCFGDERQYIEFFLDNVPKENVLFVYKNEKNVTGMFFLMPARLRYMIEGRMNDRQVFYVYAVGVLPKFRNRGIAGKMLEFAKAYAVEQNAELCLVPASKELVSYYAVRGFESLNGEQKLLQAAEDKSVGSMSSAENIIRLSNFMNEQEFNEHVEAVYYKRKEALREECTFLWSVDNFAFALREHLYTGGLIYIKATSCTDLEYIIGKQKGDQLCIREALSNGYITGNEDFDVMITTMNYGMDFIKAEKEMDGAYINFCFN